MPVKTVREAVSRAEMEEVVLRHWAKVIIPGIGGIGQVEKRNASGSILYSLKERHGFDHKVVRECGVDKKNRPVEVEQTCNESPGIERTLKAAYKLEMQRPDDWQLGPEVAAADDDEDDPAWSN